METESCQVFTGETKGSIENHALHLHTQDHKGKSIVRPQSKKIELLKNTLKVENWSERDDAVNLETKNADFHNNLSTECSSSKFNLTHTKAMFFQKIPKSETELFGNEPSTTSIDVYVDPYVNDTYNDSDLNSDPELDPFADIDCDPSFSQTPPSNTYDSATNSTKHLLPGAQRALKRNNRQRKTSDSKLQCQLCLEIQTCKSKLRTHVEICSASGSNANQSRRFCVLCNKLFYSLWSYRLHSRNSHGIGESPKGLGGFPLKCPFCPRSFALKESLAAHHSVYHGESTMPSEDSLINPGRPYKCQDCPSSFTKLSGLTTHTKRSHRNKGRFKCREPNCERAFNRCCYLKDHVIRAYSDEQPFKCQEPNCGKTFKTKYRLQNHMDFHAVERPFKCSHADCPKMFGSKVSLNYHLTVHTAARRYKTLTERPFKCEQCDRSFCWNSLLTTHLKTHSTKISDSGSIKCPKPNCNSSFKYEASLKWHIANIHTDQDALRIQCPEPDCDKIFKNKNSLRSHLFYIHPKKYASSVSFKCTKLNCDKTFKNKKGLADHLKSHTRPRKCAEPGCSARFATPTHLKWHMRSKHFLLLGNHNH